jgi:hypothetical protein
MDASKEKAWEAVLAAGVKAQQLVAGAVAVGGTASALYARHRISLDTDHLLASLRDHFERFRELLEQSPDWKTTRVEPPVLIVDDYKGIVPEWQSWSRVEAICHRIGTLLSERLILEDRV